MTRTADYGTPGWETRNWSALCWSRNVDRAVIDFVRHNMGDGAARAALLAMPVNPAVPPAPEDDER